MREERSSKRKLKPAIACWIRTWLLWRLLCNRLTPKLKVLSPHTQASSVTTTKQPFIWRTCWNLSNRTTFSSPNYSTTHNEDSLDDSLISRSDTMRLISWCWRPCWMHLANYTPAAILPVARKSWTRSFRICNCRRRLNRRKTRHVIVALTTVVTTVVVFRVLTTFLRLRCYTRDHWSSHAFTDYISIHPPVLVIQRQQGQGEIPFSPALLLWKAFLHRRVVLWSDYSPCYT